MTEEVKLEIESPDQTPEIKPDASQGTPKQEVTYTPLEQEMMTQGWKPKDQFEGADEEFVTAAEFKRRGELFKKIAETNRRLDRATQSLTALQQHQKKLYEAGYQKAIEELKAQHAVAVEDGDVKLAAKIVDQIEVTKEQAVAAKNMQVTSAEPPAAYVEFMERNASWYQKDDVMTPFADSEGYKFAQAELRAGRKPDVDAVLAHVEKKVREKFPSAFSGKRSALPPSVGPASSPTRVPQKRSTFGVDDLSEMEKVAMAAFKRDGVMTEEEYLADIKKMRGIK